jgi:hypothetical protein
VLEAAHQEPQAVHGSEALGAEHSVEAASSGPGDTRGEQTAGGLPILGTLEKPEERRAFAVEGVVVAVLQHRQAADRLSPDARQEEGRVRVAVEGIPAAIERAPGFEEQRRNPLRDVPIEAEWQAEEIPRLRTVLRVDCDDFDGGGPHGGPRR